MTEQEQKAFDQMRDAHRRLIRAYVNLLESGRDRIISLGGTCDPVDQMEAGDPALREAKEALAAANAVSMEPAQHLQDYARLMESHIAVMQDNARLREALETIISAHPVSTSLRQTDAVIAARQALDAANAVSEQHARDAVTWTPETGYVFAEQPQAQVDLSLTNEGDMPKATEPAGWRLVPVIPTEEQWGGLARDIMMWLGMDGRKTAGSLLKHLERCGTSIPQWLRDEPEIKNLDHVPSKGTRVTIIYRAMLEAAPEAK